jgi:nucleotide-binding universal stress UspA family protein
MTSKIKIIAAVDLSEYSPTIVRYSGWLAKQLNAELLLFSVINQRDLDLVNRTMTGYETFSYPDYVADLEKGRDTHLSDLIEKACPDGVSCSKFVRTGIPYRELLQAIEEQKPHLMVVGTKGRSNLADVVVGSTARKLYRRSPIPLLTIPAGFNELP